MLESELRFLPEHQQYLFLTQGPGPKLQKVEGLTDYDVGSPSIFTFLLFYPFTFLLFYPLLHSHARRCSECSEDGRRNRSDNLHNPLQGFFLCHTLLRF